MRRAVCAGSFDPVTLGHLDLIERAAEMFDEIWIAVSFNSEKKSYFSLEQRMHFLQKAVAHLKHVHIAYCEGLLIEFMVEHDAKILVRGVRGAVDLEEEMMLASVYQEMSGGKVETVFLPARPEHTFISSTVVREYIKYHRNLKNLIPTVVAEEIESLYEKAKGEEL